MAEILAPVASNFLDQTQDVPRQVDDQIRYKDLDYSPLGTLLTRLQGIETWRNTVYYWAEHTAVKFQVTLTGAVAATAADIAQDVTFNSGNIRIGYIFFHAPTRQTLQVVTFTGRTATTTTAGIKRIPVTLGTQIITGTPTLVRLSDQITQGGYYPLGEANTPTWYYNYTQICANTIAMTNTMLKVETFWGSDWPRILMETHQQHLANWEASLIWGLAINENRSWTNENMLTSSGQFTQSQGLDSRTTSHRTPYASLTADVFKDWMQQEVFGDRNHGPNDKLLLHGLGYVRQIYDFVEEKVRTVPGADFYGMRVREYGFGDFTLTFMLEKLFQENDAYENSAYALCPENMTIVALGDYLTEVKDTTMPNQDNKSAVIRTEGGFKITEESFNAYHYMP